MRHASTCRRRRNRGIRDTSGYVCIFLIELPRIDKGDGVALCFQCQATLRGFFPPCPQSHIRTKTTISTPNLIFLLILPSKSSVKSELAPSQSHFPPLPSITFKYCLFFFKIKHPTPRTAEHPRLW